MPDIRNNVIGFQGFKRRPPSIIKILGVGNGGCNAVKHMFETGLNDVSLAVCNTDAAKLYESPVEKRLQLGDAGLGVGGDPVKGREATQSSVEDIRKMLSDGTKMLFITTGLGGGTGTGGVPVIAHVAKEMGILTVGIVTLPFRYEGLNRIDKALLGLEDVAKNVDSLMVINNERLLELYPSGSWDEALAHADDTLSVAAKSIVDIIKVTAVINPDFNDVRTVLKDAGIATITSAEAEGVDRLNHAISSALNTPLLNNNNIFKAKHLLMTIFTSNAADGEPLMVTETRDLTTFMSRFDPHIDCKHAMGNDVTLGKKIKVTILASGFGLEEPPQDEDVYGEGMYHTTQGQRLTELYEHFYGPVSNNRQSWNIFEFHSSQLDDDELIDDIENSPTYKRTSRFLGNLRMRRKSADTHSDGEQQEDTAPAASPHTIFFKDADSFSLGSNHLSDNNNDTKGDASH